MNNENQNTEYKRIWKDEYLKWVCVFANAQGGKIYIGINDDMSVVGVTHLHQQLEDIPNKIGYRSCCQSYRARWKGYNRD